VPGVPEVPEVPEVPGVPEREATGNVLITKSESLVQRLFWRHPNSDRQNEAIQNTDHQNVDSQNLFIQNAGTKDSDSQSVNIQISESQNLPIAKCRQIT
jgi:hypothetical protein